MTKDYIQYNQHLLKGLQYNTTATATATATAADVPALILLQLKASL
jgi:hypothetical protein